MRAVTGKSRARCRLVVESLARAFLRSRTRLPDTPHRKVRAGSKHPSWVSRPRTTAPTLSKTWPQPSARGHAGSHPNAGVMPAIAFKTLQATFNYEISGTLISHYSKRQENPDTILGPDLVARSVAVRGREGGATAELGGAVADALRASDGGSDKPHVLLPSLEAYFHGELIPQDESGWAQWACWRVRRLMPLECERLQGMPDNYTLVPYRGKPAADAPRYKAIGNSMAVPCVAWLGQRLAQVMNA